MPHINDRIDHCVEVFIVCDSKVLLRKHDKYDIWLSIGGHIDPGEDLIEAAHREVMEEVGLRVTIIDDEAKTFADGGSLLPRPRHVFDHTVNDTHRHVAFVFYAASKTQALHPNSAHESHAKCKWVDRDELEAMKSELRQNVYQFASEALAIADAQ